MEETKAVEQNSRDADARERRRSTSYGITKFVGHGPIHDVEIEVVTEASMQPMVTVTEGDSIIFEGRLGHFAKLIRLGMAAMDAAAEPGLGKHGASR